MKRACRFFFPILIVTFALPALGQSVADVARKERERQRVLTSKVIVDTASTNSPVPAAEAAATPKPTAAGTSGAKPLEVTDSTGRDEKYWRATFQKARDDLKRAEARVELMDLRMKEINKDMLQLSSFYNREYRLGPELTAAQKDLEDARKEAEAAKQKISDLENELRKAGGPAGWAR